MMWRIGSANFTNAKRVLGSFGKDSRESILKKTWFFPYVGGMYTVDVI